ncbi:hypothetical protein ACWGDX_08870 [Streptomyces sp. NPDC055025]
MPVVLLNEQDGGNAGRRIVTGLRSRMRGRSEVLAPHAYIPRLPDGTDPPPLELFEHLTHLLAETIDQAWRTTGGHDDRLDRGLLQGVLHQGLGGGGFDGATGRMDAHGAAGGGRLTEDKLLAVLRGGGDGTTTELLCGTVVRGDAGTRWGPKGKEHPCR